MRLIFIRHGQTTGDVEGRYGGAYDDLLSPLGEQQTDQMAGELAGQGIERIFSSPLRRAQQTADKVAARAGCPVLVVPGLRERNQYGALLSGVTKEEALQKYPELVEQVEDRNNTIPGAESYTDASQRMIWAYSEVLANTGVCSAVVWHGGGMRVLFRDILQAGELQHIGDCSWVELARPAPDAPFSVCQFRRIEFGFPVPKIPLAPVENML